MFKLLILVTVTAANVLPIYHHPPMYPQMYTHPLVYTQPHVYTQPQVYTQPHLYRYPQVYTPNVYIRPPFNPIQYSHLNPIDNQEMGDEELEGTEPEGRFLLGKSATGTMTLGNLKGTVSVRQNMWTGMTATDNGAVYTVELEGGTKANTKYFTALLNDTQILGNLSIITARCGDPTTTPHTTPIPSISPFFFFSSGIELWYAFFGATEMGPIFNTNAGLWLKSSLRFFNVDGTGNFSFSGINFFPTSLLDQYNTDAAQAAIGGLVPFEPSTSPVLPEGTFPRFSVDNLWFYIAEVPPSATGATAAIGGILAAPTSWGCAQLSMG